MAGFREFLQSDKGKKFGIGVVVVGVLAAIYSVWSSVKPPDEISELNNPWFVCAETGKAYHVKLTPSMEIPAYSPYSKKNTGYPAELCFWTKDGKPKDTPTPVLLNRLRNLPEPTFCPDCGRLVVARNPIPTPGRPAPPTEAEWKAKHPK